MGLSTIIKIGSILRTSVNHLDYFKYTEPCPVSREENPLIVISMSITHNYEFDWRSVSILNYDECKNFYYLKYALSDNDSSPKKFLFGDIYYTRKCTVDSNIRIKNVREFGNFTFERGNAFNNGLSTFYEIREEIIWKKIVELVVPDVRESNREPVAKIILKKVLKEDESAIPLRYAKKYTEYIDKTTNAIRDYIRQHPLLSFQRAFQSEQEKINRLLLYAPIIRDYATSHDVLNDEHLLQQQYINYLKTQSGISNKLAQILKGNDLNSNQINSLMAFGDHSVYLHFDFKDSTYGQQWHQQPEAFNAIKDKLIGETTLCTEHGLVPVKSIHRTLCSGNDKNDIQFPGFNTNQRYKSFSFVDKEEFTNFLYSGKITNKPFRRIYATDIDQFIYPLNFTGEQADRATDTSSVQSAITLAEKLNLFFTNKAVYDDFHEPLFSFLKNPAIDFFRYYDFVFSDTGGNAVNDRITLNGISLAALRSLYERIAMISKKTHQEKAEYYYTDEPSANVNNLRIENSFRKLLSNIHLENPGSLKYNPVNRYAAHMLKVVPMIYSGNYMKDDALLNHFLEKAEFILRNMEARDCWYHYIDLKFHLIFLYRIQNVQINRYMELVTSESYHIGFMLGDMAKKLSVDHYAFERTHLANLSRNITTLEDFMKFKNLLEQKLLKYRKTHFIQRTAYDLTQVLKDFSSEYDKDACAFGFLEAYFKPFGKKDNKTKDLTLLKEINNDLTL